MTMTSHSQEHPAASWGKVALEAVKHPWKSGAVDLTLGTGYTALGVATAAPIRIVAGAAITGLGAYEMYQFVRDTRYPQHNLH